MKKFFSLFLLFFLCICQAGAVLKEQDLGKTLAVLRAELSRSAREQQKLIAWFDMNNKQQHGHILDIMNQSNQISLMLYSQKSSSTFDLAYACDQATSLYYDFAVSRQPFANMVLKLKTEIDSYDRLVSSLEVIPPMTKEAVKAFKVRADSMARAAKAAADSAIAAASGDSSLVPAVAPGPAANPKPMALDSASKAKMKDYMLSEVEQLDREACIKYASQLKTEYVNLLSRIHDDDEHYNFVDQILKRNKDYADARYKQLQKSIFSDGGTPYYNIAANLPGYFTRVSSVVADKYSTSNDPRMKSEWSGDIIFGALVFVFIAIIIGMVLGNIIIRWFVPARIARNESFKSKKPFISLALSVILFAVLLMFTMASAKLNYIALACKLLVEFAWLMCVVLVSIIIRLASTQIRAGFLLYTPIIATGFLVISFRVIFIPDDLLELIFFPIMCLCSFLQWLTMQIFRKRVAKSDISYAMISLTVMIVSAALSWQGYTFLGVQVFIWWLFQFAFLMTIVCVFDLIRDGENRFLVRRIRLDRYRIYRHNRDEALRLGKLPPAYPLHEVDLNNSELRSTYITSTWFYDLITKCILPVLIVLSFLFAFYWAADVFNMSEFCGSLFFVNFVDIEGVVQLSVLKIVVSVALFFVFRYANYIVKSLYMRYTKTRNVVNGEGNISLFNNLISIVCWGAYFLLLLSILQVPKSGISIVTAGLATGIGFAMKDLLENFFYGISLMTGRVRVGEWIECDGVRGKVESISYQSTQIQTLDGAIIAFLNSSLFTKNFRNLTRNNDYEFLTLSVGIAYGTDVNKARRVIVEALSKMEAMLPSGHMNIDLKRGIKVVVSSMSDNSVDLLVSLWSDVEKKYWVKGEGLERIYNALNANNISIPFPQRDVHIINSDSVPAKA